jgi:hypothetical protein
MGDPYKPLPAGAAVTQISRTAYNELLRMLRQWKQTGSGRGANRSGRSVCEVLIRNDRYVTAPAFSILGIDAPLISPFNDRFACQQRPAFAGVEPTVADHLGKWVALEEPIGAGKIGRAVLVGFAVVRLYVNGADDEYCDVIDAEELGGETVYLGTGPTGAQILWRENEGSGKDTICWAIVRMGTTCMHPMIAWATTTAAVATTDTTFTVKLVVPFDGSTWSGDGAGSGAPYLTVSNDPDDYEIGSGARGKIISAISAGVVTWHPLDFPCPA